MSIGYRLLGRKFNYLVINAQSIESVDWSTGQATAMAGHDMNDWHVAMWFDADEKSRKRAGIHKPDKGIYIVGPSDRKEKTEALGLAFIAFLREAGASLTERDEDGKAVFRRPDPEDQTQEPRADSAHR